MGGTASSDSSMAQKLNPDTSTLAAYTDDDLKQYLILHRVPTEHLKTRKALLDKALEVHASEKSPLPPPKGAAGIEIALNVYNLVPKERNGVFSALGFGLYHSGVEILSYEWSFGGSGAPCDPNMSGIFYLKPGSALPQEMFCERIVLGMTYKTVHSIYKIIEGMRKEWLAASYHLLNKNCNHFAEALVLALNPILEFPSFVNRAARVANFVIPEALYKAILERTPRAPVNPQNIPESEMIGNNSEEEEKKKSAKTVRVLPPLPPSEEIRKMTVRELKALMFARNISSEGCIEKADMIDKLLKS